MEPGIHFEELLKPEATLPVQFHEIWHGHRPVTPERTLVVVVLWQAAVDLQKYRFARRRKQQRLYMQAYRWMASDDRSWPYSFVNLCEVLKLSPECLREELLNGNGSRRNRLESAPVLEEAA
jgi:hypothetical protein